MIHLGLLGWPVSHSLSPKLHNAALKAMGLEGEYSLYPVEPGNDLLLENLLSKVRVGELRGLNVTIPYKQAVIPLLDRLSLSAKSIGAVNTIFLENGLLVGHNTDAPGFRMDLKKFSGNAFTRRSGGALILGAGGSARARKAEGRCARAAPGVWSCSIVGPETGGASRPRLLCPPIFAGPHPRLCASSLGEAARWHVATAGHDRLPTRAGASFAAVSRSTACRVTRGRSLFANTGGHKGARSAPVRSEN